MRILLGSAYFESHRGGIEIVAGRLAREFGRRGHDVAWIAADATSPPAAGDGANGRPVPLRAFNGTERRLGIPLPVPGLGAIRAIRREVARADVMHLHDALYPANIAAFLCALMAGKPVVLTQHIAAVPYRHAVPRALMRAMNRLIARPMLARADQVVFIGNATAKAFADVAFRRPPRLIFNGVDTGTFRPAADQAEKASARRQFGLSAGRPIALFVGRFVEKKGLSVLQHAAAAGTDIDWVFAGWGNLDPVRWGLPNVHVRGGLDQAALAPLYRASDALVLPSTGEGFPLVLQEAMASGLPCVCSAETAEADDRIGALVRGVALDPADPAASASQMLAAVRAAIAQDTLEGARQRSDLMQSWYGWPQAAQAYEDIFQNVIEMARRSQGHSPQAVAAGVGS